MRTDSSAVLPSLYLQVLPEDVDRDNVADLSDRILKPFVMGGGGVAAISQRIDSRKLAIDLAEATAGIPFQASLPALQYPP
jgi:hypothetical protein